VNKLAQKNPVNVTAWLNSNHFPDYHITDELYCQTSFHAQQAQNHKVLRLLHTLHSFTGD